MIEIRNVSFGYSEDAPVLQRGFGPIFARRRVTGVIGPNGLGQNHALPPDRRAGSARRGRNHPGWRARARPFPQGLARRLAVVPQSARMDFDFTVRDIVMMGRHAHIGRFQRPSARDIAAVRTGHARNRRLRLCRKNSSPGLSGGEWQRVLIARALCQEAGTLLLDEPVSNLDLQYQLSTLRQMRALAREKNACVVCVLHTLTSPPTIATTSSCSGAAKCTRGGAPADVITPATLREVYGVEAVACPLPAAKPKWLRCIDAAPNRQKSLPDEGRCRNRS